MTDKQLTPAEAEAYRQYPVKMKSIHPYTKGTDVNEHDRNIFLAGVKWREESRWQDISTAPKDGIKIDLWLVRIDNATLRLCDCWFYHGRWIRDNDEDVENEYWTATHWMQQPLPPSPSKHS